MLNPRLKKLRRDLHERRVREGSHAAFDLLGELTTVPTGYLIVALRNNSKSEILQRVADELVVRSISAGTALQQNRTGTCSWCSKPALRFSGKRRACRFHTVFLIHKRRHTGTQLHDARFAAYSAMKQNELMKLDSARQHHKARGLSHP